MSGHASGAGEPDLGPVEGGAVGFDAVVVAAGGSTRMGGVDKMEATVAGRPVLAWALEALTATPGLGSSVIVTAAGKVARLAAAEWLPAAVTAVVAGGARRQESVAAGVAALGDGVPDRPVLVHDGARPLATPLLIAAVAAAAAAHGAAIPVLPVAETLKRIVGQVVAGTIDRESVGTAQTPQGIRRDVLLAAYAAFPPEGPPTFTDEASLLEACRIPVHAIPGEPANLKVTLPDDLARADAALVMRAGCVSAPAGNRAADPSAVRIGYGDDVHPFGPGEPLMLGGIVFVGAPRLHGHSDGDVLLHAVCDALLGAAGLGDLGRVFPAGPSTPARIASTELLVECLRRVRAAGLRPSSLDCTIIAARPKLGARLPEMAAVIATLLALPVGRVNVKASTGNLANSEGSGRGISARVVALCIPEDAA